jgi:NHLM bacteriocin system ABC transporter peptidase/ATP-binding protein
MRSSASRRVKATTVLQYEATECGAASLATILRYYGRIVPLPQLRRECGVNRDGSNAQRVLLAARGYGLQAKAYRCSGEQLVSQGNFPCVVFWGFNHFLVLEGFDKQHAYVSDPAEGRCRLTQQEFFDNFTGVVLEFSPGPDFKRGGHDESPLLMLPGLLLPYRKQLLSLMLVASILLVPNLLVAGLTSSFISDFLQDERLYFGIPIVWLLGFSCVLWLILMVVQFVLLRRLELLLSKKLTVDLFEKLFSVPWAFFQVRMAGELASRMVLGMRVTQVVVSQLLRFLVSIWAALLLMVVTCLISFWLTALVAVVLAFNLLFNWWLTVRRYDANRKLAIEQGKAQGRALQGINTIDTLKSSGLEFDFLSQWQANFGSVVEQNQLLGSQLAWSSISASSATLLLSALVITVGGLLIIEGRISLGLLVSFQFLQAQLVAPISTLPQLSSTFQRLIGDLGRLMDLTTTADDPHVRSFQVARSDVIDSDRRLQGRITLDGVTYGFNDTDPPFMPAIDLDVPAGSRLALVGASGSGKTTLIRMLAGLVDPLRGHVLFDGKTWDQLDDQVVRGSIAYVPQQVFVFNASLRDNITLWNPDFTDEELQDAAADAQLLGMINGQPEGFQRQLRDNGSDLSGGERQRLEICRALIRRPSILLLDEATSSLDNVTQRQVIDAVQKRGITVVTCAHRLDAALESQQVLVLSHGKVVERGRPDDLLANPDGAFSALVAAERRDQVEV